MDRYLFVNAGISRADCFVTNLVRDWDGEDEIQPEEIERDWPDLMAEMQRVQPKYVGFVGSYAARQFLVSDEWDMDTFHGLAWPPECDWEDDSPIRKKVLRPFWAMGTYHPAAGLHMPAIAARIAWDFTQFGRMVRGEPLPTGHLCDNIKPFYTELHEIGGGNVAVDTEGSVERPWGLSVCGNAGDAYVVRTGGTAALGGVTKLHHALHDLPVLEAMGVKVVNFTDTMVMAALLGTEPQSLKALARRWCGMSMQDYSDVVREARREKALEYLSKVLDWCPLDAPKPKPVRKPRKKKTLTEELESTPLPRVGVDSDIPF